MPDLLTLLGPKTICRHDPSLCDGTYHGDVVDLHGQDLVGAIPTEIGRLWWLKSLDLSSNHLGPAPIPTEIGRLGRLTELMLDNNELGGKVPTELGRLNQLTELTLFRNSLSSSFPTQIGHLWRLRTLFLFDNKFQGDLPTEIGRLQQLQTFAVYHNHFSGQLPTQLNWLNNLEYCYLSQGTTSAFDCPLPWRLPEACDVPRCVMSPPSPPGLPPTAIGIVIHTTTRWYYFIPFLAAFIYIAIRIIYDGSTAEQQIRYREKSIQAWANAKAYCEDVPIRSRAFFDQLPIRWNIFVSDTLPSSYAWALEQLSAFPETFVNARAAFPEWLNAAKEELRALPQTLPKRWATFVFIATRRMRTMRNWGEEQLLGRSRTRSDDSSSEDVSDDDDDDDDSSDNESGDAADDNKGKTSKRPKLTPEEKARRKEEKKDLKVAKKKARHEMKEAKREAAAAAKAVKKEEAAAKKEVKQQAAASDSPKQGSLSARFGKPKAPPPAERLPPPDDAVMQDLPTAKSTATKQETRPVEEPKSTTPTSVATPSRAGALGAPPVAGSQQSKPDYDSDSGSEPSDSDD